MTQINLPTEQDFRRWIKEALDEYFREHPVPNTGNQVKQLNRKQISAILDVSLVTLHQWMKKGLPSHRDGGRVYFLQDEVLLFVETEGLAKRKRTAQVHYLSSVKHRMSA